ncbi:Kinase binding protein CGI-121 [Pseudohyphozyma bogoriensis]|nr:Kinase binding protein CGI-121 [Pseudohyphozyma bogoriensis]
METYPLATRTIRLALFTQLQNAAALRKSLVEASTLPDDEAGNAARKAVEFTFIDASMITSRLHALTAVHQALVAEAEGEMKTKTVQSEVLWELEPGTNIAESLKHFGLSPSTTSLLLVHFAPPASEGGEGDEEVFEAMAKVVEGTLSSLDLLGNLPEGGTSYKSLRKTYKLNQEAVMKDVKGDKEGEVVDTLCVSAVALKAAN